MYLRAVHAEADIKVLQEFIKKNPLGIFTTAIKSSNFPLIQATHIPFVLDVPETDEASKDSDPDNTQAYYGLLRGHLARANPHAKALMEAISAAQNEVNDASLIELPDEVMVLFNGAAHHYVTPKFYVESKPADGKVVPTWNYSAVQAYGKIRIYCDSRSEQTSSFLQKQVGDLSSHAETSIMGYTGGEKPAAWSVSDAPVPYIDVMKKAIIGFDIRIHRLAGKYKMSQESSQGDREGVINGFNALGSDVGRDIAQLVKERAVKKEAQLRANQKT